MRRPENHATRRQEDTLRADLLANPMPPPSEELLAWLEAQYPPRCYANDEQLEDHLLYAGRVQLIEELRQALELHEEQDEEETA